MEVTGKVIAVLPLLSGVSARTGNQWAKQDFVIEIPGQYPRRICFEVFGQDRIDQFDVQMGEEITVSFDITATEYQGKWYNKLSAWQVVRGGAAAAPAGNAAGTTATPVQGAAPAAAPAGNPAGAAIQQPLPERTIASADNTQTEGVDNLPF